MADERVDVYKRINNLTEIDGVEVKSENTDLMEIVNVNILNENGAKALSKEVGAYVTMQIKEIKYLGEAEKKQIIDNLSKKITELIGNDNKKSVLVVGLGNVYVTPDALGPKVVQNIDVTRHLLTFAKEFVSEDTRSVSAISPGVLGTTGIETFEIVESIVKKTTPDVVIVIDSLVSQSVNRVGNTIQLSDTGITPGAGVRNKRESINKSNLNIPVIAIGVPTVVDMATITIEAVEKMSAGTDQNKLYDVFKNIDMGVVYSEISNKLDTENYIVTPKEIDDIILRVAEIISSGINLAM
jgi:spore protease